MLATPYRRLPSHRLSPWALLLPFYAALSGCVTRGDIDVLHEGQKDIAARLERMERRQSQPVVQPQAAIVPPRPAQPTADDVMAYPLNHAPVRGPKDAWVTIVAISDFQCPFCKRGADTASKMVSSYPVGDVRLAFKNMPLPFHARAIPAAIAALCAAKQQRFWDMHDRIFAAQSDLEDNHFLAHAKVLGLDLASFKRCLNSAEPRAQVTADMAEAQLFGVRGTPAFFINGHFLSGAQPEAAFRRIIDAELAVAKKSGHKRDTYYADVVEAAGKKTL